MRHESNQRASGIPKYLLLFVVTLSVLMAVTSLLITARGAPATESASSLAISASGTPQIYLPLIMKNYCPAEARRMPFGVQMLGEVGNPAAITLAAQSGADWVRFLVQWSDIEPVLTTPHSYNWAAYDSKFSDVTDQHLFPIVTIFGNPEWARETGFEGYPHGLIAEEHLIDFQEFLAALVQRYGAPPYNVKYWELYNEPDCFDATHAANCSAQGGYWGQWPDRYAEMLHAAYDAIKAADPQAQVVFGALAYDWFTDDELVDPDGPFVRSFLDDVLGAGGGNYFDVMNFHYYVLFHSRWNPPNIAGKAAKIRSILANHDVSKPLINTEIGSWSIDRSEPGSPDEYGGEEKQARYVIQGNVRGMFANLEAIIWFTLLDFETEWGYGLLSSDYSPKPSYHAYQTLAQELRGAEYQAPLSLSETGSSQVEGYKFTLPCPDREQWVLWTTDGSNRRVSFPWPSLRWVDKEGNEHYVYDGGAGDLDGSVNGRVSIYVGPSPIYAGPPP